MNLSVHLFLFFKLSLIPKVPNVCLAASWISLPACPKQNFFLQNLVFLYSSPQLTEIESSELFSILLSH